MKLVAFFKTCGSKYDEYYGGDKMFKGEMRKINFSTNMKPNRYKTVMLQSTK